MSLTKEGIMNKTIFGVAVFIFSLICGQAIFAAARDCGEEITTMVHSLKLDATQQAKIKEQLK